MALARAVMEFRADLKGAGFGLALDLQGLLKSAWPAWLSGAPIRIGVGSREMSHLLLTHVFSDHDLTRVSSQYREFATYLGLDTEDFRMEVALSDLERGFAADRLDEFGIDAGYAVLVPFTTWPQKHWPEQSWARLAERLEARVGLRSVLLGGPGDRGGADKIQTESQAEIVDLVGRTSLTEASAVIERADLVVGVDTGLNHVGIAFDRPTVSLFGANIPYYETPSDRGQILYKTLPCAPCHRRPTCGGRFTCMALITVEEVVDAAERALAHAAGTAPDTA